MKKYFTAFLSTVAFLAGIALIAGHVAFEGIHTVVFAVLAIALGYWFGTWTCHFHTKRSGLWITIIIFMLLNLLHSMIDGASIEGAGSFMGSLAVFMHELARQPALYIVLWGMLAPFPFAKYHKLVLVPLVVTGVWIIGSYLGFVFFKTLSDASWMHGIADQAMFFFLGDLLHHVREEWRKLRSARACCHEDHAH